MIGCCGRLGVYHVIWGGGGGQEDARGNSLACAKYGHVIFCASRKTK